MIENTQRDVNIALVNELALIFDRMGLDTLEVLEAAGADWHRVTGFIHGTTLATNALIERRGAATATITTRGFLPRLLSRPKDTSSGEKGAAAPGCCAAARLCA